MFPLRKKQDTNTEHQHGLSHPSGPNFRQQSADDLTQISGVEAHQLLFP